MVVDRVRFEDVWTGEVILVKRDYEISDEDQPFGLGLVAALMFRERWIVRDVTICAVMLGFLALTPIMFWRLMSDRVLYFKAYNTFYVLCLAMADPDCIRGGFYLFAPIPDSAHDARGPT